MSLHEVVWSPDDGVERLSERIEIAIAVMDTSPQSAAYVFTQVIQMITENLDTVSRKEKGVLKDLLRKSQDGHDSAIILAYLQKANDHIANMRMVGHGFVGEEYQIVDPISVFEDNKNARENIALAHEFAQKRRVRKFREEILNLNDVRALEYKGALARIRDIRIGTIASAYGWDTQDRVQDIFVHPDCRMVGGSFSFTISIKNTSKYVITDVNVTIVSFPGDCMKLSTEINKSLQRIEVSGFRNVKFDLQATKDCVEGKIIAVISYIDYRDTLHSIVASPFAIRSVCDLLQPQKSSKSDFENEVRCLLEKGQTARLNWNAGILVKKLHAILPAMNFHLVSSESNQIGTKTLGTVLGFALGKYTRKRVAVSIRITGGINDDHSTVEVTVAGDDEAMLPTTIEELVNKISAWTCLECGAKLNPEQIGDLESGKGVRCNYCSHSLTIDLYCKGECTPSSTIELEADHESISEEVAIGTTKQTPTPVSIEHLKGIVAYRGCETIGGNFEYKVKVENKSKFVITNVTITIVTFPSNALQLIGNNVKRVPRIEVGGFRSLGFSFIPLKDCVEGKIVVVVSFSDLMDRVHVLNVEPYVIKSVCDLLKPLESSLEDFSSFLQDVNTANEEREYDINPRILSMKALRSLEARNFSIVDTDERMDKEDYVSIIRGFAEGKYTSKRVGLIVMISGPLKGLHSFVKIEASSNQTSMLPIAIEEIKTELDSWTCLRCGSPIQLQEVTKMMKNHPVKCDSCGQFLSMELYRK